MGSYKEQQAHLSDIHHVNYLYCVKAKGELYSPRICEPCTSNQTKDKALFLSVKVPCY